MPGATPAPLNAKGAGGALAPNKPVVWCVGWGIIMPLLTMPPDAVLGLLNPKVGAVLFTGPPNPVAGVPNTFIGAPEALAGALLCPPNALAGAPNAVPGPDLCAPNVLAGADEPPKLKV